MNANPRFFGGLLGSFQILRTAKKLGMSLAKLTVATHTHTHLLEDDVVHASYACLLQIALQLLKAPIFADVAKEQRLVIL